MKEKSIRKGQKEDIAKARKRREKEVRAVLGKGKGRKRWKQFVEHNCEIPLNSLPLPKLG